MCEGRACEIGGDGNGMKFKDEAELAAMVVAWLKDLHWEVYQEVEPARFDAIADIVAVRNGIVWVIETKLSLSLSVLSQAANWHYRAHYVSVAVPTAHRQRTWAATLAVLQRYGIGMLEATSGWAVTEHHQPQLHRTARVDLILGCLTERHKTYAAAGNANGRRLTPFKQTCEELSQIVSERPGITLKDAIDGMNHHYQSSATAKSSLSQWIHQGIVDGVEFRKEGRKNFLFPCKDSPESTETEALP